MGKTQSAGNRGEAAVARYLRQKGYTLLESQWRCPWFGELDLVAKDKRGLLCIVEVKLRGSGSIALPVSLWTAASSNGSAVPQSCIWRRTSWTYRSGSTWRRFMTRAAASAFPILKTLLFSLIKEEPDMKYYSTRDKNVSLSAAEAVKMGLSRDGGLLTPTRIPQIDRAFWSG